MNDLGWLFGIERMMPKSLETEVRRLEALTLPVIELLEKDLIAIKKIVPHLSMLIVSIVRMNSKSFSFFVMLAP